MLKNEDKDNNTNRGYNPVDNVNLFIAKDKEIIKNVDFLKGLVFNAVSFILSVELGIELNNIKPDTDLRTDFITDETDIFHIIMTIGGEFDIDIDKKTEEFKTIKDIVDYVAKEKLKQVPVRN